MKALKNHMQNGAFPGAAAQAPGSAEAMLQALLAAGKKGSRREARRGALLLVHVLNPHLNSNTASIKTHLCLKNFFLVHFGYFYATLTN